MKEYPAGMDEWEGILRGRVKGGNKAEQEANWEDKDTEGDRLVAPVDEEQGTGEEQTEQGLGLVGVDGKTMVRGVKHFGEGDEVEENGGDSGRDSNMPPARAVIECGGQDRERGYTVEKDGDSEPEEGHNHGSPAAKLANLQYIGYGVEGEAAVGGRD